MSTELELPQTPSSGDEQPEDIKLDDSKPNYCLVRERPHTKFTLQVDFATLTSFINNEDLSKRGNLTLLKKMLKSIHYRTNQVCHYKEKRENVVSSFTMEVKISDYLQKFLELETNISSRAVITKKMSDIIKPYKQENGSLWDISKNKKLCKLFDRFEVKDKEGNVMSPKTPFRYCDLQSFLKPHYTKIENPVVIPLEIPTINLELTKLITV